MDWIRDKKKISELYSLYKTGNLQLQPFFQRNLVWTNDAKSLFIESILLKLPISEVYLYEDTSGLLSVIDGQQRLSTIFHFMEGAFKLQGLEKLTNLEGEDITFSYRQEFENFDIYYVKIDKNVTRNDIIDTYARINRYTVNLNDQEIRRATYHDSDFLKLSEELSQLEFFQYGRFFTSRKRERMNDVEFISELLSCQLDGIQDKKNTLNDFYKNKTKLADYKVQRDRFLTIISDIEQIFNHPIYFVDEKKKYDGTHPAKNLGSTRYRQQADFYSLFFLMKVLKDENVILTAENKENFIKLLLVYNYLIEPEALIDILGTYAVKCVSQGNTKKSREFRYTFLRESLDYICTGIENKLIGMLRKDFQEVFDYSFDPLNIDLNNFYKVIDDFYEEIEEDD